MGEKYMNLLI